MHLRDFKTPGSAKYRWYRVTLNNIIISYTHYRVGLSRGIKYEFEQTPYGNLARKGSYRDPQQGGVGINIPFWTYLPRKVPKRAPPYDKNARGVPLLLRVFYPFFSKILVQNALFIKVGGPNFMEERAENL
jgi:hypothetical protein